MSLFNHHFCVVRGGRNCNQNNFNSIYYCVQIHIYFDKRENSQNEVAKVLVISVSNVLTTWGDNRPYVKFGTYVGT